MTWLRFVNVWRAEQTAPWNFGWWIRGQPKIGAPRPPQVLEGLADHWAEELIEHACSIARLRPERELQATDIALAAGMRAAAPLFHMLGCVVNPWPAQIMCLR
jgi:hypothetical protein